MVTFKPMLAAKLEDIGLDNLTYPLLASPKLDGVRALVIDGVVMSRSLKPIPNKHVQKLFGRPELEGFDGELCVGPATAKDLMQRTMSGVMSEDGEPDVTYHVFDLWEDSDAFAKRQPRAAYLASRLRGCVPVHHSAVETENQLLELEAAYLAEGYEGIMLRTLEGGYKQGRCGKKQPWLIKVKRFEDSEAIVIGVEELMHNDNEATINELGRTKRSTHQENKRPAGVLGALICKTPEGVVFNIGTGFTAEQRAQLWRAHCIARGGWPSPGGDELYKWALATDPLGRIVKYKHFACSGVKEAPRFPVFLGFRDKRDL